MLGLIQQCNLVGWHEEKAERQLCGGDAGSFTKYQPSGEAPFGPLSSGSKMSQPNANYPCIALYKACRHH